MSFIKVVRILQEWGDGGDNGSHDSAVRVLGCHYIEQIRYDWWIGYQ
jgi:hypothetical protein